MEETRSVIGRAASPLGAVLSAVDLFSPARKGLRALPGHAKWPDFIVLTLAFILSCAGLHAEVPIHYELSQTGLVSLAVYNAQGQQVRTLLSGAKQNAGPQAVSWDGLDWTGRPVAPGTYEWRLLQNQGLKSEFLLRLGTSVNHQEWTCNHDGPHGVAVRGDLAYEFGGGECVPKAVIINLSNQTVAGYAQSVPGDVAIVGDRLYGLGVAGDSDTLGVKDLATGKILAKRNLLYYAKRLDFQAAEANPEPGWQEVPLAIYDPKQGFGWDNVDGLKAASDVPGARSTLKDYHGPDTKGLAAEMGADPYGLYVFRVDVPKGKYIVNVLMGTGTEPFEVELYCGLKDGKPVFLQIEKFEEGVGGQGKGNDKPSTLSRTITFEAAIDANQLVLGFKALKTQKGGKGPGTFWTLRGVTVVAKPDRVAASGTALAVGYPANGTVRWLNASSPDLKDLGTAQVDGLCDLDLLPNGHAVVVTSSQLVEVGRGQPPEIKATDLVNGKFVSVDTSNGDIIVAPRWSGSIRRFDKTYKPTATYGRVGGRQQGLYNPEDFFAICALASDNRGGFLVVENWSAPRRLAHFGPDGKLIKEWCGGQLFFTGSSADPADARRVWMNSHWGWLMEVEADYGTRTWKTRSTYCLTGLADGLVPAGGTVNNWTVRRHGNQRYLVASGRMPCVLLVDEENRRLLPMLAAGCNVRASGCESAVVRSVIAEANAKAPAGSSYDAFLWQDQNGDGRVQKEEVRPSIGRGWAEWGSPWSVDADLTFSHLKPEKDGTDFLLYRLPVKEWVGNRPVYPIWDDVKPQRVPLTSEQKKAKTSWGGGGFSVTSRGDVYQQIHGKGEGFLAGFWNSPAHSSVWPNNLIGEAALCKWSPEKGALEWRVGRLNTAGSPSPGTMNSSASILGYAHGCVLFSNRILQPMEAWTEDGLYAGGIFQNRTDDGLPGAYYSWWRGPDKNGKSMEAPLQYDMFAGGGMTTATNGDVLFFGCGWNNVPVYRVTGWESFGRQSGKVELKDPALRAAGMGTGLYGEFFLNDALQGEPVRRRLTRKLQLYQPYWPKTPEGKEAACARWTGFIEARFSEKYRIKAYVDKGRDITEKGVKKRTPNDRVRIWVADKLVLDGWDNTRGEHLTSGPVALKAGEKTPLKIEYVKMGKYGNLHFCWESASQEIEHVPAVCLYPPDGIAVDPEPVDKKGDAGPALVEPAMSAEPEPAMFNAIMAE